MSDVLPVVKSESWGRTHIKLVNFSYTWTISNFSFCPTETGNELRSPSFSTGEKDNFKWCLTIYPRGLDPGDKDYVSVFLHLILCHKAEIRAKFKFSILNAKLQEIETYSQVMQKFSQGSSSGCKKFVRRDFLFDEANHVLPDDQLTLFCEIHAAADSVNTSGRNKAFPYKVPKRQVSEDLGYLFESQQFCDAILCAKGTEFCIHRNILTARSSVFSAMFKHEMKESKQNRVEITDIDPEVLQEMLRFIYTGKVLNLENMADKLLVAADKYDLDRLKIICGKNLYSNLSVENAADVLILADMHNVEQLKTCAINFINNFANSVMQTAGWKSMELQQPHLVAETFRILVSHQTPTIGQPRKHIEGPQNIE